MGKHGTRRTAKAKTLKTKLGRPDLDHAKRRYLRAFVRRNQSEGIGMPSTNSSSDTVGAKTVFQQGRGGPPPDRP
jgi:hypothetical protein